MVGRSSGVRSVTGKSSVHSEGNVQSSVNGNVFVSIRRVDMWPFFVARRFPSYIKNAKELYDVPNETWAKWIKVMHDFRDVQREMRFYYEKNH